MKYSRQLFLLVLLGTGCAVIMMAQTRRSSGSVLLGVFVGTTPCADAAKPMLKIPPGDRCDRIKWELSLYQDESSRTPTTYHLKREFGYHVDNRTSASKGEIIIEGKWSITRGTRQYANAIIYSLETGNAGQVLMFMKAGERLLHLLNKDKSLQVGNGAYSYTLSKTTNR